MESGSPVNLVVSLGTFESMEDVPLVGGAWYTSDQDIDALHEVYYQFYASGALVIEYYLNGELNEEFSGNYDWYPDSGLLVYYLPNTSPFRMTIVFHDLTHATFTDFSGSSMEFERVPIEKKIKWPWEPDYDKAQHRIPPVIYTLNVPDQVVSGESNNYYWSVVGYHDDYDVKLIIYDEDGDILLEQEVSPYTEVPVPGPYQWDDEVISKVFVYRIEDAVMDFNYSQDLKLRFFISPINDPIDTTFLSCIIPGGFDHRYGDTSGRVLLLNGIVNGTQQKPDDGQKNKEGKTNINIESSDDFIDAATREKAQHRLPPVIFSLDIPKEVHRLSKEEFAWSVMGYHEDYNVKLVIENQNKERILYKEVKPYNREQGMYSWESISSYEFFYKTDIEHLQFTDDQELTIRFQISPPGDSFSTAFLPCIIPGGLGYETAGDTSGRKIIVSGIDDRESGVYFYEDITDIPHILTMFTTTDYLEFVGEAADEFRSLLEKEHYIVAFALFAALQYDGYMTAFLASEGNLDEFLENIIDENVTPEDAILAAAGIWGDVANLAIQLLQYWAMFNVVDHIIDSRGDLYIVFPDHQAYEIPVEETYNNGFIFAADDLTEKTLAEVRIIGEHLIDPDCVYYSFLNEEETNPDGFTLGKGNWSWSIIDFEPVPNSWEKSWFGFGDWEAPDSICRR